MRLPLELPLRSPPYDPGRRDGVTTHDPVCYRLSSSPWKGTVPGVSSAHLADQGEEDGLPSSILSIADSSAIHFALAIEHA